MPEAGPRYWAFLSYSHADLRIALRLHRALESYVVPRRLVGRPTPAGQAPRRLRPIFRDLDEMGAGASLSGRLKAALDASACLIVICSPAAAASPWVNEEIRRFKAERGEERILSVIVGGEPFASERPGGEAQECFPPALRQRHADGERIEPIAADLRPGRRDTLRAAVLKLVAGVLDIELDELVQRDAQRRSRQLLALTSAFGAIAASMAALALMALTERDEARRERGQAEGLVEFMISDLKDKLEPAGRLDILDAIGGRAQAYYAAEKSGTLDARSLGQSARVLHLLGDIRMQRGDLAAALSLFRAAAQSTGEILRRRPNDPQAIYNHAQSVAYIGEAAWQSGDFAAALPKLLEYQSLARRLAATDPPNTKWQTEVEEADTDLGVVLLSLARADESVSDFQDALTVSRRLTVAAPSKRKAFYDETQILAWLADAEVARGRLDAALADRADAASIYDKLIAESPQDDQAAMGRADNRLAVAKIELATGAAAAATSTLEAAQTDIDRLVREAPDNTERTIDAFVVLRLLAQSLLQQGRLDEAALVVGRATDLCEAQVRTEAVQRDKELRWRGARLGVARIIALKVAAARARTPQAQRQVLRDAPGEAARLRALLAGLPNDRALAVTTAEAALLAGDFEDLGGAPAQAAGDWRWAQTTLRQSSPDDRVTDRNWMVLRQASYRLRSLHPPTGPLPADGRVRVRPPPNISRAPVDYRW
jgi:tetratricopeptide (TPR) repeat protein